MTHIRMDLERLYQQREQLFRDRWALGARKYAVASSVLRSTIYGLELVLCISLHESISDIFRPYPD